MWSQTSQNGNSGTFKLSQDGSNGDRKINSNNNYRGGKKLLMMALGGFFPLINNIPSTEVVVPGNVFSNRITSISLFLGLSNQVVILAVIMGNVGGKVSNPMQVVFQVPVLSKSWKSSCSPVAVNLPVEVIDESGFNADNADNKKGKNS